jgi:S1-C subfamily serine protease
MLGTLAHFVQHVRRPALATVAAAAMVLPALSTSSIARGPDNISDVAEKVIDAVVNISTSQKVEARNTPMPQLPNDPQLDELFRDFFNRRGQGDPQNRERGPRRVNSLGSAHRQGPENRHRAAQGQARQAAQGGQVRRFGEAAAGRMGHRHRQPVQPRRERHRRHRLGAQP